MNLKQAILLYLDQVSLARSRNTARTYRNALNMFIQTLHQHNLSVETKTPADLPEEAIVWFAQSLKNYAPTTERLYLSAAVSLYQYLSAENLASPNLIRIQMLIRQRARRPGQRLPQFSAYNIELILNNAINIALSSNKTKNLRNLRDRAFLITLADTGLRVHEACRLRRGDIDWFEGHAIVIGKGDRQDIVRFSSRSLNALKEYLTCRASLDGNSGRPLSSLPLFARHDKGTGKRIESITTATGRNIVSRWVRRVLGDEAVGSITPHSFRHYFVTSVLKGSGNLKLAQELARHRSIAVTQRYAHLSDEELDKGYWNIFENKNI